jgi:hypothetical protein
MNNFSRGVFTLMANAVPLAAIIGAVVVILHDKDGWGWLLLVAAITHVSYSWSPSDRRTHITDGDLRLLERHFGIRYDNDLGTFSKLERAQRSPEPR